MGYNSKNSNMEKKLIYVSDHQINYSKRVFNLLRRMYEDRRFISKLSVDEYIKKNKIKIRLRNVMEFINPKDDEHKQFSVDVCVKHINKLIGKKEYNKLNDSDWSEWESQHHYNWKKQIAKTEIITNEVVKSIRKGKYHEIVDQIKKNVKKHKIMIHGKFPYGEWELMVKNDNNKIIYHEKSDGLWVMNTYDDDNYLVLQENSNGVWEKWVYDDKLDNKKKKALLRKENSYGQWSKYQYNNFGNIIYYEKHDGFNKKWIYNENQELIEERINDDEPPTNENDTEHQMLFDTGLV